jgi:hypothetical protein
MSVFDTQKSSKNINQPEKKIILLFIRCPKNTLSQDDLILKKFPT